MTVSTGGDPFDPFEDQPTPTGPAAAAPAQDIPDLDVEGTIVALAEAFNDAPERAGTAGGHCRP